MSALAVTACSAAFWLLCARVSYATLVRRDWLHAMTSHGEYVYDSNRDCPDWHQASHSIRGRCSRCSQRQVVADDWEATRRQRLCMSFFLGPLVLVTAAIGFAVGAGQPVQREERECRLKQAEEKLAAATAELDKLKEGQ